MHSGITSPQSGQELHWITQQFPSAFCLSARLENQWDESPRQTLNCKMQIVSAALSRVVCLHGCRLRVAEVNLIRRNAAGLLNAAGWTPPVHTVSPSLLFPSLSDFHLPSRCSESNPSPSPPAVCCLSLAFLLFLSLSPLVNLGKTNLYRRLTSAAFPPKASCCLHWTPNGGCLLY